MYDLVVVGVGPAGARPARRLAEAGHEPVCVASAVSESVVEEA